MKKILYFALAAITLTLVACNGNEPENNGNNEQPINAPEGAINGIFSVGPNTKVYFSKGNLQATVNCASQILVQSRWRISWHFAENQWEILGKEANELAVGNIEYDTNYHMDLFGWGTGKDPRKISTHGEEYTTFEDWGNNKISNGGNAPGLWRTLKNEEWEYLFIGRANADKLFSLGTVNGVNGVILLPDNWPSNQMYDETDKKGLYDDYPNQAYHSSVKDWFTLHSYADEVWTAMEKAGAVFLPVAGQRTGLVVFYTGKVGYYWSDTPYIREGLEESMAYYLVFYNDLLIPQYSFTKDTGNSVRLVQDVK